MARTSSQSWQQTVPQDLRDDSMQKVIQACFPASDILNLQDSKRIVNTAYAEELESSTFCTPASRAEYYKLVLEQFLMLQKQLHGKSRKRKMASQQIDQDPDLRPMIGSNFGGPSPTCVNISSDEEAFVNEDQIIRDLIYPPPPETDRICVSNKDFACLKNRVFLNDVIIDFYLKYLYKEKLSTYQREKTHMFSSYFFPRLTHKPEQPNVKKVKKIVQVSRHSQVKTWTKNVDIFTKDFLIIPINIDVHWFLAIICFPGLVAGASESSIKPNSKINKSKTDNETSTDDKGNYHNPYENSQGSNSSMIEQELSSQESSSQELRRGTHVQKRCKKEMPCICIFDSLNRHNRYKIISVLRKYLEDEWFVRKGTRKVFDKTTMPGYIMECPQQNNNSDCGVYVLQYVESFFENPIPRFDSPIPNLSYWFSKKKVARKRQELKKLILNLQKKYSTTASG